MNAGNKKIKLKALIYQPRKKEYYLLQNINDINEIEEEGEYFQQYICRKP